jgi:hypothetical protein
MQCPHCGERVRAYRVFPEFSCRKCGRKISSNSFSAGLVATLAAILIAIPFEHTCTYYGSPSWVCGSLIFVGAVALAYLFVYCPLLRLKVADGGEAHR